jgi:DNA-binding transcriptional LysR family regulator
MHDLRRVRAFHAVALNGSFSIAARELGYAQSVVSHHVSALEREVGLTLINRGTRPVSVTAAGSALLLHAERILGYVTAAEDEMRAVAGLESGTLRIGAFASACVSFVPRALLQFGAEHPNVEVRLEHVEEPEVFRLLRSGDLDLAVVFSPWQPPEKRRQQREDGFEEVHLADDPHRVALPPNHPLVRRRALTMTHLARERFIVPVAQLYRDAVERLCAAAGFQPQVAHMVQDITVARALVAAGLGVALLSNFALPPPHVDISVRPLANTTPFRSVQVAWLRGRHVPAAPQMIQHLAAAAAVAQSD